MILVSHRLTLQRLKQVQRVLPLGLSRELREIKISHNFREVFTSACSRQRQNKDKPEYIDRTLKIPNVDMATR